ncbi:VCBS domain-containing protein [Thalassotalea agariperforans]
MKKQIIALSLLASLSACEIDNSGAKKVAANFNNEFTTEVGFDGTTGKGMEVELTVGHGSAEGTIVVTDVNYGEADPDYAQIPEGNYGTFVMTEEGDGAWTYDLDETHPEVAALMGNTNATLTDTITLTSLDGTQGDLNFIIKGVAADIPAEFRGAFVANVSLKETLGFGRAEVYDENFNESFFRVEGDAKYGVFTMNPDGRWEYELDKRHPDLQSLVTPEDATFEEFTVYSADGTENTFKVNITGAPLNFAVQVPSETDLTSVFAINFLGENVAIGDVSDGKLLFSAKTTEDLATTGKIGMTCGSWNGNNDGGGDNRRVAQLFLTPDSEITMWSAPIVPGGSYSNGSQDYAKNENNQFITEHVVFDQMHIPGEWTEFAMTWEYRAASDKTYLTLSINDEVASSDHGAIPADPTEKFVAQTVAGNGKYKCLQEMRFFIQKNQDKGGVGALLVDDIKFYTNIDADVKFDTPDFEDSFSNSSDGDSIQKAENPRYKAVTTDNIFIIRDL